VDQDGKPQGSLTGRRVGTSGKAMNPVSAAIGSSQLKSHDSKNAKGGPSRPALDISTMAESPSSYAHPLVVPQFWHL
jgi:hypothetical protein